jgi:hypothetical protein
MNHHVALMLSCLVHPLAAQAHGPIGADPGGVVLDEKLQPLAGATVRLVARTPTGVFTRAMANAIASTPLPTTRSGRDGSYVLPMTDALRRIDAGSWSSSGLWLVVEREGFRPWREPLPAGTAHWLGSRVVLRAVRDEPFAEMPWPPAVVDHATQQGFWAWLPMDGNAFPSMPEPARVMAEPGPDAPAPRPVRIDIQVKANGAPVAEATLWFDDGASDPALPGLQLPTRTDAAGRAVAVVPGGGERMRRLRVIAPGFIAQTSEVPTDAKQRVEIDLEPAQFVDLLAVDADGAPQPFAALNLIPHTRDGGLESLTRFADANGRLRFAVASPAAWFVYGQRGSVTQRIELRSDAADGIVRVPVRRAVTVVLRGDDWPRQGELTWERDDGTGQRRAFRAHPAPAEFVVLRLANRDCARLTIGGDERPPFVIRREDLPAPAADPLLDIAVLDRRVRVRAKLQPSGADGTDVLRLVVRPDWQQDGALYGASIRCSRQVDGQWLLQLRDDQPYGVVATAFRRQSLRFVVPMAVDGAEPPTLPLVMQAK